MTFAVESSPDEIAVAFARVLRSLDIPTPLDSVLTFMNALSLVGIDDRESVYWAVPRKVTTLCRSNQTTLECRGDRAFRGRGTVTGSF